MNQFYILGHSYTPRTLLACCSQSELMILKIPESSARALFLYNCTPNKIWLFILEFRNKNVIFSNQKQKCQKFVTLNPKHFIKVGNRKISILLMINYFNHIIPQQHDHFTLTKNMNSSVASPICQEGQSERTFPIFPLFSRFLANFLLSGVALWPPLPPQWLCHWTWIIVSRYFSQKQQFEEPFLLILNKKIFESNWIMKNFEIKCPKTSINGTFIIAQMNFRPIRVIHVISKTIPKRNALKSGQLVSINVE